MKYRMKYSPTSINKFWTDRENWYIDYVCRAPRSPQTRPMSVGSAFDAYIKAYIFKKFGGTPMGLDQIAASVEPQNLEWAKEAGRQVFKDYFQLGLADLASELVGESARMEETLIDSWSGIQLLGKPDLLLSDRVLDWKVSGFCGKRRTSPKKFHMEHKDVVDIGLGIDTHHTMMDVDKLWGLQLCIYGWLGGLSSPLKPKLFIVGIDQIAYHPARVYRYRNRCTIGMQEEVWSSIVEMDELIKNGDFGLDTERLDGAFKGGDDKERWFSQNCRKRGGFYV